jgi:DNA-binding CsgD family transcriptional regulator
MNDGRPDSELLQFGIELRQLRESRGYSRSHFVRRVQMFAFTSGDSRLADLGLVIDEAWLSRVEMGRIAKVREEVVELLIRAVGCTPRETISLLDCLVPDIYKRYLSKFSKPMKYSPAGRPKTEGLTARQLDVLRLAANGVPCRSIMKQLVITKPTVDSHWRRIIDELDAQDRKDAIGIARMRGLI